MSTEALQGLLEYPSNTHPEKHAVGEHLAERANQAEHPQRLKEGKTRNK